MLKRMLFLSLLFFLSLGLALSTALSVSAQVVQTPLAPNKIPQFAQALPVLDLGNTGNGIAIATGTTTNGTQVLTINMEEFNAKVLPPGTPLVGNLAGTTRVWGYRTTSPTAPVETYIGPVVLAQRGTPTQITWVNNLGNTATSQLLAYKQSTDQTLMWADPLNNESNDCYNSIQPGLAPSAACASFYSGPIPAVVHLHGGEVPAFLDGGPDAWFTSLATNGLKGHGYYTHPGVPSASNVAVYRYPNTQEAANIWFHDHTLGATRLNVYAGLAGGYVISDSANDPVGLPGPIVPIIIQDRMFDTTGQLFFPNIGINPEHPYWIPEFVGDTIVVNGKAWPFFNVQPKRYRFLFLNGSNARAYELYLINKATGIKGPAMWQIGTDGGYLDAPVKIDPNVKPLDKLVIMPGERADVIIDFAGFAPGTKLLLANTAKTPYPAGGPVNGATTGRIMEFRLIAGTGTDATYNPAAPNAPPLRSPMVRLVNPLTGTLAVTAQKTRRLTLNEVIGAGGPLEVLVNNTKLSGESFRTYEDFEAINHNGNTTFYSELPKEGETEIWEVINLTADAHPIHLHLVQFQLMNRQNFDLKKYTTAYNAAFPGGTDPKTELSYPPGVYIPGFGPPLAYGTGTPVGGNPDVAFSLKGLIVPPVANEAGWKDTVIMYPGQVTRIAVRWAPTDLPATTAAADAYFPFDPNHGHGYVWHCHIIDHEDNEMMRPTSVISNESATRSYIEGIDY